MKYKSRIPIALDELTGARAAKVYVETIRMNTLIALHLANKELDGQFYTPAQFMSGERIPNEWPLCDIIYVEEKVIYFIREDKVIGELTSS
jgi:hypothetical protein